MAVSRAAQKPARVVRFVDTLQHPQKVDADDSKAAAVLSTLVFECGDKNATMPITKQNVHPNVHTVAATHACSTCLGVKIAQHPLHQQASRSTHLQNR